MTETELLPLVPGDIRDGALAELSRLSRTVAGIEVASWKQPSAVSSWSIGEVVAHLDLAFGVYNRLLDAIVAGGGSGPLWRRVSKMTGSMIPAAAPVLNTINSAIPKVMGSTLEPEVVKGQFAAGSRKLRERLERLSPADYNRPINYVGGTYPLSFFLALIVNELAIHGWDIESRLETVAELSADARRILPWFYWSGTKLMLRLPESSNGTIQAVLTEPGEAMWWRAEGRTVTTGRNTVTSTDTTIRGDSATFVLTLAGRIKADGTSPGALSIHGNRELGQAFLNGWTVI